MAHRNEALDSQGRRRVVITGVGAVTPGGLDVAANYAGLSKGRSFISRLDNPFIAEVPNGGVVRGFDPAIYGMGVKDQKNLTRDVRLTVAALMQALVVAGYINHFTDLPEITREQRANRDEPWLRTKVLARRVGVEVGSAIGGSNTFADLNRDAKSIFRLDISQIVGTPAMMIDARGPSNTRVNACAGSVISIGEAARKIRDNEADIMIAGGGEAPLVWQTYNDFHRMGALSTIEDPEQASRPLDQGYKGFLPAEGAVMFVLEPLEMARERGAYKYAEIISFAQTTDTSSPFVPNGYATYDAMQTAIERSGRDLKDFNHASLHASGTPTGDPQEVNALRKVFGKYAENLWINTPKSYYGHALGAAGALAFLQLVLSMRDGVIFANPNQSNPIPEAEGLKLPQKTQADKPNLSIVNGIGLEGVNASVVVQAIAT